MAKTKPELGYDLNSLAREQKRHYISASNTEIQEMLQSIGLERLEELFSHVPSNCRSNPQLNIPEELSYSSLQDHLFELSEKNRPKTAFLGHGLQAYKVPEIVSHVLGLRKLTTAYTPYQPERSQGTLITQWIYQSAISAITGFEAVNASLYERSTALFEAIKCAQRLKRGMNKAIVADSIFPGDREVLETMACETDLELIFAPVNLETGKTDHKKLLEILKAEAASLCALCFPQNNALGVLEDVDVWTDLAKENNLKSIAIIDPILLGEGGLKEPVQFGSSGADMFVAEGQHLALAPNYGGPGLGIFGIRFSEANKNDVRSTPGRFIGKAKDVNGREALSIVLSTREQHIRRDKATSNICSNQAYVATIAGAALLQRGAQGLSKSVMTALASAHDTISRLIALEGVDLAFKQSVSANEYALKIDADISQLISEGSQSGLHIGVDISKRFDSANSCLLVSFSDLQSKKDCDRLVQFFETKFTRKKSSAPTLLPIPKEHLRSTKLSLPEYSYDELKNYYNQLAEQNVSPDQNLYALGSCTMKYNPYINDWAAALPGFQNIHPEAPLEDVQGALEIIYETQNYFKEICGLAAVTTQPVAGAQGELVGLKMFQAYHRSRGDLERNVVLIPRSAHGTNPATATVAGFLSKMQDGKKIGVVEVEADSRGQIDLKHLDELLKKYSNSISGVMVTNPNTSGILELNFKKMADLIHGVGGLVYMDGANMNAIAGWVDLSKLGVDAVHNNTHKTWTIPHGGGGPGDAFVAVSEKLVDFLPGAQVVQKNGRFELARTKHSIGSVHRHLGNFAHKVRCYTYLRALGCEGVPQMSAIAVLAARYLYQKISKEFPSLPSEASSEPRMHEFIITLAKESFEMLEAKDLKKSLVIPRIGKLFLDFGLHAPTVAFPEQYGLMIEPTESFTKVELDRFVEILASINKLVHQNPEVLHTVPHFTPIDRVDEVEANKNLKFFQDLESLPAVNEARLSSDHLDKMSVSEIAQKIISSHQAAIS